MTTALENLIQQERLELAASSPEQISVFFDQVNQLSEPHQIVAVRAIIQHDRTHICAKPFQHPAFKAWATKMYYDVTKDLACQYS